MKVSIAIIAAIPALSSARKLRSPDVELPNVEISSTSVMGSRILSKARRLEGGNNNNNVDMTWVSGYSLKFHSCVTSQDYYGGYFADNQDNAAANYEYNGDNNNEEEAAAEQEAQAYGNSYYNNEQRNDYEGMYYQKLVHFKLCPSNSCWMCKNGADYVVELNDYVDAVLEAQMTAKEYNCEHVRENCYCGSASSEEECLNGCFSNAGLTDCTATEEGAFDLQKAIECMDLEVDKDKLAEFYNTEAVNNYAAEGQNNNQVEKLFAGPYCSADGKKILLGVFVEETCSYAAPTGIYEALHYGESLPYAKKSLIGSGCTSCKEPSNVEDQNNWDQQDADSVLEVCSTLYAAAGKCEEGLSGYSAYRDNSGCEYIKSLKNPALISMPNTNIPAKVFAGIFGVTTVALAALTVSLCRQKNRQNVSLTDDHPLA